MSLHQVKKNQAHYVSQNMSLDNKQEIILIPSSLTNPRNLKRTYWNK